MKFGVVLPVAALAGAAMWAAPAHAQSWQMGQSVKASPVELNTVWYDCTIVGGPNNNGWYQAKCGATTYWVSPQWIRPGAAAARAPAARLPVPRPHATIVARPRAATPPIRRNAGGALPGSIPTGAYECWAFNTPRMLLNFTVTGPGRYRASDGSAGTFSYDSGSGAVRFTGYLADVVPAGWQVVYHEPQGKPTVSFRNRNSEASFCEHV